MNPLLSQKEIEQLTGYRYAKAQIRALRLMGVRHFVRPDGKPVVAVSALEAQTERTKPNLDAINNAA